MKNKRSLSVLSLLVALCMVLSISACSAQPAQTQTPAASSPAASSAVQSSAPAESSPAAASSAASSAPAESSSAAASPSGKKLKDQLVIGCSQRWGTTAFPRTIAQGAIECAAEWEKKTGSKIKVVVTDSGINDPQKQVADMEDLAAQKVDGLLLFPGDSKMVSEPLKNIYNKNNIPVVITDIGVDSGEYLSFIITDNKLGGEMGAEIMAKAIPKGSKVLVFNNAPGNINAQNRARGFESKAKELGLTVLPEKPLNISVEEGKKLMEDTLAAEPDIGGIFTITIETAIGAASALKDAKNTKCKIVAFDLNDVGLQLVKEGGLEACIVQDPYFMGYEGMNQMMYYLLGETDKIKKRIDSPPGALTKLNSADYENNPQVKLK